MTEEQEVKRQITLRLKAYPKFYHYCSACSAYLCCMTEFHQYIVHFDCRNKKIKYFNAPDNPPPEANYPRHNPT